MTTNAGGVPAFIQPDISLAPVTSFGIGGPARWLAKPGNRDELAETVAFAKQRELPILVLGGGSNLLVADAGVEAVVVRLEGEFSQISVARDDELIWRAGAAVPLALFLTTTAEAGVSGLEMLAGIPGRVGGAVAMNAGAWSGCIGEYVEEAEVYDFSSGEFRTLSSRELGFSYRRSAVGRFLALGFTFVFSGMAEPEAIFGRMREYRERKKASQPLGKPSAGCVFKNPAGDSAGSLLDQAGCKGMREGAAEVSGLHANFIVNQGGAGSGDVARLAVRMREAVWRKFELELEPELILWGEDEVFSALRPKAGGETGQE